MTYRADVLEVLIASPGDVAEERDVVRSVIHVWNATYARERRVALMPVGWETHSSPELSGRPQQIINDRLLTHADVLVGIFWTRVGSPTGKAISGSVEEIEVHLSENKPVMLYFSDAPVQLDKVDYEQYKNLKEFKRWALDRGLVESFSTRDEFRAKFQRQLPLVLRDNAYIKSIIANGIIIPGPAIVTLPDRDNSAPTLSSDAIELLTAAATDKNGLILVQRSLAGKSIASNGKSFGNDGSRRSIARWEEALDQLLRSGFIRDQNGHDAMFEVTDAGFRYVEAKG